MLSYLQKNRLLLRHISFCRKCILEIGFVIRYLESVLTFLSIIRGIFSSGSVYSVRYTNSVITVCVWFLSIRSLLVFRSSYFPLHFLQLIDILGFSAPVFEICQISLLHDTQRLCFWVFYNLCWFVFCSDCLVTISFVVS